MSSSADKTTATAASRLISLAAAGLAVISLYVFFFFCGWKGQLAAVASWKTWLLRNKTEVSKILEMKYQRSNCVAKLRESGGKFNVGVQLT